LSRDASKISLQDTRLTTHVIWNAFGNLRTEVEHDQSVSQTHNQLHVVLNKQDCQSFRAQSAEHLKKAARSIGYRHENETLAVSLAQRRPAETDLPQPIEIVGGPAWTRTRNQTVMSEPTNHDDRDKSKS